MVRIQNQIISGVVRAFKGFMCIRMRKLYAECQIPADAYDWCQIVFSFNVPKFVANIERQKSYGIFLDNWLELWPSIFRISHNGLHSFGILGYSTTHWTNWKIHSKFIPYLSAVTDIFLLICVLWGLWASTKSYHWTKQHIWFFLNRE